MAFYLCVFSHFTFLHIKSNNIFIYNNIYFCFKCNLCFLKRCLYVFVMESLPSETPQSINFFFKAKFWP